FHFLTRFSYSRTSPLYLLLFLSFFFFILIILPFLISTLFPYTTLFRSTHFLAATSVGVLADKNIAVDLNYEEDSKAAVDMNVVMTGNGEFVEIQGTGEEATFSYDQLQSLLRLAEEGIQEIMKKQNDVLGDIANHITNE